MKFYPRRLLPLTVLSALIPTLYAELAPKTLAAFHAYVAEQELRVKKQEQSVKDFLWIDREPKRRAALRSGTVVVNKLAAPVAPGGLIQHWIGAAFFPGATLAAVQKVDQDYNRYHEMYAPDIVSSKLTARHGDSFDIYYRLRKKKILTTILDTRHRVDYYPISAHRNALSSRSTDLREVQNAGSPSEKILEPGRGQGFVWAMNSYWRMEEADGGVYIECEAITLGRSIPMGMGFVIGSSIESLAIESLTTTLLAKKRAVALVR